MAGVLRKEPFGHRKCHAQREDCGETEGAVVCRLELGCPKPRTTAAAGAQNREELPSPGFRGSRPC